MLPSTMPSAVAQALRACGRTLPSAKSMAVIGPSSTSSTTSRVLARRTFLIAPTYKARVASRGYATATAAATATKKAASTRASKARIAPAKKTKKSATPKSKAKPKAKAKAKAPKKVVKKKKPGPAKQLTPEKKALLEKRELRKAALLHGEPKKETTTVWTTYVSERIKHESISGPGKNFGEVITRLSADFKGLSDSEKTRIEQKNLQNKATNSANYKKWVESHSIAEIYKANLARNRLTRTFNVKTRKIIDDRLPKRPTTAFAHFVKARMSSHNGNQTMIAAVKDMSTEWKSLSASDKKPFEDLMTAEKSRYVREMQGTGLPAPQIAA